MSINSRYYILSRPDNDQIPMLVPDKATSNRPYYNKKLEPGKPLVFKNKWRDENIEEDIQELIGPILFSRSDILVSTKIKLELEKIRNPLIAFYPSIYVDDNDKWHEDYWFTTFLDDIDCWDRKASGYYKEHENSFGQFPVYEYVLDEKILGDALTPKNSLFRMGGTLLDHIFVHESIINIFQSAGNCINITGVDQYSG